MTPMPSLYETQRRHAACYCDVLKAIRQAYDRGGDEQAAGLQRFDRLWPQIKQGQAWAAAHAAEDAEAARLCLDYVWNSDMIMSLKGLERERIDWLKQAQGVNADARDQITLWSEIGEMYNSLRELDMALLHFDLALQFADRFGMHRESAETLTRKATVLKNLNRYIESKATFDEAIKRLKQLGEWPQFTTLHNLANLFDRWGKLSQARYTIERALKLAVKEEDDVKEAAAKHTLAGIQLQLGELDTALKLALEAHDINAGLGESYRNLQGMVLLGEIYEQKGMRSEADYWRARAAEGVQDDRYDSKRRFAIRHSGREALWRQGRVSEARAVAEAMVVDAQRHEDAAAEIQALLGAGANAQAQDDLLSATESWRRALDLSDQAGDVFGKAAATGNLGLIRYLEGDIEGAIALYEQGMQLAEDNSHTDVLLNILGNLGNAYFDVGWQQEALNCYERGLELARRKGAEEDAAKLAGYIGRLQLINERYTEAISAFESAANTLRARGNHYMSAWFTHLHGVAYWYLGDRERALALNRQALATAELIGNAEIAQQIQAVIDEWSYGE